MGFDSTVQLLDVDAVKALLAEEEEPHTRKGKRRRDREKEREAKEEQEPSPVRCPARAHARSRTTGGDPPAMACGGLRVVPGGAASLLRGRAHANGARVPAPRHRLLQGPTQSAAGGQPRAARRPAGARRPRRGALPPAGVGAIRVCQNVNVYGFDPPEALPLTEERPYHYFEKQAAPPTDSLQAEFMMLRALHTARYITLCTVRPHPTSSCSFATSWECVTLRALHTARYITLCTFATLTNLKRKHTPLTRLVGWDDCNGAPARNSVTECYTFVTIWLHVRHDAVWELEHQLTHESVRVRASGKRNLANYIYQPGKKVVR
eukprot:1004057-Prorocentrum_minimum.AAC.1